MSCRSYWVTRIVEELKVRQLTELTVTWSRLNKFMSETVRHESVFFLEL